MKNLFIIFLTLSFVFGCKGTKTKGEELANETGIGGLTIPTERNLLESEIVIGKNICAALKKKRELFEVLTNLQEKFRFRLEANSCDSLTSNLPLNVFEFDAAISNSSSTDFEYIAASKLNYFRDVVTDQAGVMKVICDNLSKSEEVSNTIIIGNAYLVLSFLIKDGFNRYEIGKKIKSTDGKFQVTSIEGVNVITQSSQGPAKFFGVEQERIRYVSCPNSTKTSYIKQNWLRAVTSF
jgi:hypothetical protein